MEWFPQWKRVTGRIRIALRRSHKDQAGQPALAGISFPACSKVPPKQRDTTVSAVVNGAQVGAYDLQGGCS
jgi:hypothetical protein